MKKKVISTRLDNEHIALAIDGLSSKGYKPEQLNNISNIVRLTFYYGLASLGMAEQQASEESQAWVTRNLTQNGKSRGVSLSEIK